MDRPLLVGTLLIMCNLLSACVWVGPASVHSGRPAYNDAINLTEDQQLLQLIVRHRYDESFGMLAVTSVTASLRAGASAGANVGIGPSENYAGNLVPFSAGATYEENPTISYVPIRGEKFIGQMLAPISAEQTLLLSRMSTDEVEALRILVRRANGLANPLYAAGDTSDRNTGFDRFIDLYAQLRDLGKLDIVRTSNDQFEMLFHDYTAEESAAVEEILDTLRLERPRTNDGRFSVPLRFFVGSPRKDGIDLETPSALEVIGAASDGMDVPGEHVAAGVVRPTSAGAFNRFLAIKCSRERPAWAAVAVTHRGWWFFIDDRDTRSKQGFVFLRTLIGLRMDQGIQGQGAPLLTVPVTR